MENLKIKNNNGMMVDVSKFNKNFEKEFSICTLVNDFQVYNNMVGSFQAKGFGGECEYLYIDNSLGNVYDAFSAINFFLRIAKGRFVILCHQDVLLHADGKDKLLKEIGEIDSIDPKWALLGNAGGKSFKKYAIRISDPHGENVKVGGPFPAKVMSLDENFILVRAEANLAVSSDVGGFHLYGTDLCLIASILGYSSYVVDFHLKHLSPGNVGKKNDKENGSFAQSKRSLIKKYNKSLSSRWINTTCTKMFLSGSILFSYIFNLGFFVKLRRKVDFFSRK